MSAPIVVDGRETVVTMSVGAAISQPGDEDADGLVRKADVAMSQAKVGGRNGCRIFEKSYGRRFVGSLPPCTKLKADVAAVAARTREWLAR